MGEGHSGEDFTLGKDALGDVNYLQSVSILMDKIKIVILRKIVPE